MFKRWLKRTALALFVLLALATTILLVDAWTAMGKAPSGERLARMERSPLRRDGVFQNIDPMWNDIWGSITMGDEPGRSPEGPLPVETGVAERLRTPPSTNLRVTWLGHSTVLLEVEGKRILIDPIWGERTSPSSWFGPERWYPPPLPLAELPELDVVLISHDHYDHLDAPTLMRMKDLDTTFLVPLGVGAHLEYWGIPAERIVEREWWETFEINGLTFTCAPARHASGRHVLDQGRTLWAGWAIHGSERRVFYAGDTGLFMGMREIGERLGPFDLVMIEVGAYNRAWPDWHIGPEQAIEAHQMLRGDLFLPVHWGLFNLAAHSWTEPIERVVVAAQAAGVRYASPRPGGSVEPLLILPPERWWPDGPWRTAEESPIVSTRTPARPTAP